MTPFIGLPSFIQGFVGLCTVLLLFANVANVFLEIKHRYYKYIYSRTVIVVFLYMMFQCICDICSHMNTNVGLLNQMEDYLGQVPIYIFVLLILTITVLEIFNFHQNRTWEREHITPSSIKEAIDNLPVGICCYEPSGQIMMKNKRMENICLAYTGTSLLNAVSFRNGLHMENPHKEEDEAIFRVDDKVFSLSDHPFSKEDEILRVMTVADITEQYQNTQKLKEQQQMVVKLNEQLSDYGKKIVSSITAKEVLNAKVKIHDELGANLLAIKRYILNGGEVEERIAIESILHKNLQSLKNEMAVTVKDEYAVILDTADKLDMKIYVIGELTETEPQRHVIVTGIHECLTNTIRHAGGDELTVILEEDANMLSARFTNNGKAPEGKIKERGGLALLKVLTEECGGTMQILASPRFELIIKLPKEVMRHVL